MVTIDTANTTGKKLDLEAFFSTIRKVLKKYGVTGNLKVELCFVGRQRMQELNREFRNQDYPTDVLSFPIWPDRAIVKKQRGPLLLGSIVVCLPVAKIEADGEGQPLKEKINFLVEHSMQHLLGFHHKGD